MRTPDPSFLFHTPAFHAHEDVVVGDVTQRARADSHNGIAAAELVAQRAAEPLSLPGRDVLPTFTALSTDVDWQRKAEYRPPGTYYVVARPESFADLEEYRQRPAEGDSGDEGETPVTASGFAPSGPRSAVLRSENVAVDGETVLLAAFEDDPPGSAIVATTPSSGLGLPPAPPVNAVSTSSRRGSSISPIVSALDCSTHQLWSCQPSWHTSRPGLF